MFDSITNWFGGLFEDKTEEEVNPYYWGWSLDLENGTYNPNKEETFINWWNVDVPLINEYTDYEIPLDGQIIGYTDEFLQAGERETNNFLDNLKFNSMSAGTLILIGVVAYFGFKVILEEEIKTQYKKARSGK